MYKKVLASVMLLCLIVTGCGSKNKQEEPEVQTGPPVDPSQQVMENQELEPLEQDAQTQMQENTVPETETGQQLEEAGMTNGQTIQEQMPVTEEAQVQTQSQIQPSSQEMVDMSQVVRDDFLNNEPEPIKGILLTSADIEAGQGIAMKEKNMLEPAYEEGHEETKDIVVYKDEYVTARYSYTQAPVANDEQAAALCMEQEKEAKKDYPTDLIFSQYELDDGTFMYLDAIVNEKEKKGYYVVLEDIGLPNLMRIIIEDGSYEDGKDVRATADMWRLGKQELVTEDRLVTEDEETADETPTQTVEVINDTPEQTAQTETGTGPAEEGVLEQGSMEENESAGYERGSQVQETPQENSKNSVVQRAEYGTQKFYLGSSYMDLSLDMFPGFTPVSVTDYFVSFNDQNKTLLSYSDSAIKVGDILSADKWMSEQQSTFSSDKYTLNGKQCFVTTKEDGMYKEWRILQDVGGENYLLIYVSAKNGTYTDKQVMEIFALKIQ